MKGTAACYEELREYVEGVPLIDCHDHSAECGPKYGDAIQVACSGYFRSDLQSASSDEEIAIIEDADRPLAERWPVLERAWMRFELTWTATPGEHVVRVRATDVRGNAQPMSQPANRKGYLLNVVLPHPVTVL